MRRAVIGFAALAILSGCDVLNPDDPRLGVENVEACLQRVSTETREENFDKVAIEGELVTPTFTYDITKASVEDLRKIIVPGSDETAGTRGMATTNQTSTAVENFMAQPVDEKGAFFFGRDPALFRVRGEPLPLNEAMRAGCERQLAGMRLIAFRVAFPQSEPENPDDTSSETEITE